MKLEFSITVRCPYCLTRLEIATPKPVEVIDSKPAVIVGYQRALAFASRHHAECQGNPLADVPLQLEFTA